MSFAENLKTFMKLKKITANEIADKVGVTRGTVTHWSNGLRFPKDDITIKALAEALGVSEQDLFNDSQKPVARIPIIGEASCGMPINDNMQITDSYCLYRGDFWNKSLYCVIATGDSMAPEIEHGDEVVCDPTVKPTSGDIVHYKIGDESAIKVFVEDIEANIIQFIPYNPGESFKIKTVRLDDFEAESVQIAKVVAINKLKFNNRAARLKLIGRA